MLEFLELPAFTPDGFEKHNGYDYRGMGDAVHARLVEHYREPNRLLYESSATTSAGAPSANRGGG